MKSNIICLCIALISVTQLLAYEVVIPDGTHMGSSYEDDQDVTSVVIGNNCYIDFWCFNGCSNIKSIVIGDSCKFVGRCFESAGDHAIVTMGYGNIPWNERKNEPDTSEVCGLQFQRSSIDVINIPCGTYENYDKMWHRYIMPFKEPNPQYSFEVHNANGGSVSILRKYECDNDTTLFQAFSDYGYHFTQWNDGNKDNPRTIIVTQDTAFTAEFAKNIYTISTQAEHGSVAGGGDYEYLSTVQLTATADEHYHFVRWSDEVTDNPRQITIEGDQTYTAIFSIDQHTISASAEHGKVIGTGIYDYGTEATLTVISDVGYEFATWYDGSTDNPRTIELTQDTTLEAIFDYQLTGKCGKENSLTWTLDKSTMALNITGTGALSENYTYGTFIESLTINNEITVIGQGAFYGCNNLKNIIIGSSVKVLEEYAFYDCSAIKTITCYSQRPPTVNNYALYGLDYGTIIYVPADYLNTYKMHDAWGLYDVQPIGAKNVETTEVTTSTTSNNVTITWPITDGTDTYTLTISKNGEVVCVLTFNANGQLINIAFAAPGHNGAHQAPAATLTAQGYQFTVTGLNPGTAYDYSVTATDAGGQTLAEHKGNFSTTGGTGLNTLPYEGKDGIGSKYFHNGNLIIERNGIKYTATGQKVR